MYFFYFILACDIKVDLCTQLNELLYIAKVKSFTDLCPGCLRFSIFNFSSKTSGLIETKLHEGMNVGAQNLSYITKLAAMPI